MWCCLLLPALTIASPLTRPAPSLLILKSGDAQVYSLVAKQLEQRLLPGLCQQEDSGCKGLEIHSFVVNESKPVHRHYDLAITLGLKAREYAALHLADGATVNAMIPRTAVPKGQDRWPMLILDQPLWRSLRLIRLSLPKARRVGVLISEINRPLMERLTRQAALLGLESHIELIEDEAEIGRKITPLLDQVDVLLALPDPKVHNRNTVSNILLTSYRNRVPVIGFSAAYVHAGAFAAVYSKPEDIAHQLAELADHYFRLGHLRPGIIYPEYFSIAINAEVARSLGIPAPSAAEIGSRLRQETK